MPARTLPPLLAALFALACASSTDITRSDDDVEAWVAEQEAEQKDAKARGSLLGKAPPPISQRATAPGQAPPTTPGPCNHDWYVYVEKKVPIADPEGHGPDLGSEEWKSAVEHHLGVREDPSFPDPTTPAWCHAVDKRLQPSPD